MITAEEASLLKSKFACFEDSTDTISAIDYHIREAAANGSDKVYLTINQNTKIIQLIRDAGFSYKLKSLQGDISQILITW